jgi:hypothetical protein
MRHFRVTVVKIYRSDKNTSCQTSEPRATLLAVRFRAGDAQFQPSRIDVFGPSLGCRFNVRIKVAGFVGYELPLAKLPRAPQKFALKPGVQPHR